ncbi:hypothetical protein ABMA27_006996 [Loxostege sticticalis]|uniref:Chitin-binding type-2 domain-containing protein n=1 Tax=Loxostege sticticalis TaxID=481309 RepID=A0ABR3ILA1_LOXSC
MRSFGVSALVAFAIVTECFGAQSDRSRQRSGPIRSVPVAADIKRDVDFDCPEEFGYYPHPSDCTLYYVCVFGGALLESCTGGLMYSHELQTCDWPRNVGCDGGSAVGGEELERISEREPPPPPPPPAPRRTPPPPPPRVQPNPVVTSRGQPKFNREEYEKLYAEVDDLPPVEEIESDRQQRVYRGQPSTIGQVQKDRDGYTQVNTGGRNVNSNIIPASISQNNGKIGSFSFGTQVDERRTATITQAPQTYSLEPTESVAPVSYSASPRPKMLYNGSQSYNPDQYDPFYAVYDEDGELYKDTVQQTYRGTPPPARRPVETYSPRPVADEYDDALIQGQINNQNQYQSPIRHSTRSPTDENPKKSPEPSPSQNPSDGSNSSIQSSPSPIINLSSLAKPFERTDNTHRLSETILSTEKTPISRHSSRVTNNNKDSVDVVQPSSNENKKVASLTTGFSIRRNLNNTNNPYTLTVLTRPLDEYSKSRRRTKVSENIKNRELQASRYYYESENNKEPQESKAALDLSEYRSSSESITPRKDSSPEIINEEVPVYTRPTVHITSKPNYVRTTEPTTTSTATTKYYLKTVLRRPAPFSINNAQNVDSTENSINTEALIDTALENSRGNRLPNVEPTKSAIEEAFKSQNDRSDEVWDEPIVSPYRALNNLRNSYNNEDNYIPESTSTTTSTTRVTNPYPRRPEKPRSKPSYYSYRVLDEIIPDQTTEVFSGTVKNVIKAFFNNLVSTPAPRLLDEFSITTPRPTPKTTPEPEEKTINIGFQKKMLKYVNDKPLRNNVKRIQIITEPSINQFISSNDEEVSVTESDFRNDYSSTSTTSSPTPEPIIITESPTTQKMLESSTNNDYRNIPSSRFYNFNSFVPSRPEPQNSRKFQQLFDETPTEPASPDSNSNIRSDDATTKVSNEGTKDPSVIDWDRPTNKLVSEMASTTSTTKSTSTARVEPTTSTKSLSFPTRASRVNPAIKLAATNLGGGRRSYQTPSKCSSDNSLQANPKCNEIKYQRPSSTRGRGHAHYSAASEAPAPIPNRGTPPTRSRPTLKPSTAIVSKSTEYVDIYAHPPSRPAPVYPQPTPDKTAAKCRKDVCLLPDCFCGGRDIPGDLPVETVPQIVLLTFDDSVNDLNKGLYMDLFEKGRVNPNGCPITATFYVSHEWTDYSQVQNLYSAGHEMASHTVSHSFGEQFSQKKWNREVGGQREILAAYGGVKLEDVRGMRAPFLSVGGNKMFKMLYDSNFTYDSSLPVYENRPPSWPYTLDYKLFHDCMIPPCPTKSYPGVWEVPMVMWQDLNGGRCSMGDACANPPDAEGVYKMILKNFDRHYTTNRAPFGLYYHAAWFTQPHHKEGFIMFLDFINSMQDVWIVTNWQALQWVRDPTPISRINNFQPFQCNYQDRPKKCNNPKVCNLWHKSGVRYMRTCQPCPEVYPWTGKTGIKSSRIDNDIGE